MSYKLVILQLFVAVISAQLFDDEGSGAAEELELRHELLSINHGSIFRGSSSRTGIHCNEFVRMVGRMTADGDITNVIPGRMNTYQCQAACKNAPSYRHCAAAILKHGGKCTLAGYSLKKSNGTTHYRRICANGRGCFKQIEDRVSSYHTGYINVPTMFLHSDFLMADFCRRECQELVYCAGFDVVRHQSYCPFLEFRPTRHNLFVSHFKNCEKT